MNLRCPNCNDFISIRTEWRGQPYTSYEANVGFECDNYKCGAEWDLTGSVTVGSRI